MNEKLDSLKGQSLPSLPCEFQEYAYASVWRLLHRRRWARRGQVALIISVGVCFIWMTTIFLPNMVVRKFLEKLPLEELIAIHSELVPKWPDVSIFAPPLHQVIERSDVLVHAKVFDVTPNADDIINDIIEAEDIINRILNREEVMLEDSIRVNLRLQVFKSYPPIDIRELIAVRRDSIGNLYYIKKGREGIFALRQSRGGMFDFCRFKSKGTPLYNIAVEHGSIYLIDPKRNVVSGIPGAAKALPLNKAWEFVCDLYDSVYGDEQAKDTILNK